MLLIPLISLFVIIHFTVILLGVIPPNPITVKHNRLINAYTNPMFTQNWHLFAPDPISNNTTTYLQVKYIDKTDDIITSEWIDVSTGLVDANKQKYLSPINRLVRVNTGVKSSVAIQDDLTWQYINSEKAQKNEKMEEYEKLLEENTDKYSKKLLQRHANSLASKRFKEKEIKETRIMWVLEESIPFSERNNNNFEPELSSITSDWYSYFYVVPPLK
jgi:hypothetical protein